MNDVTWMDWYQSLAELSSAPEPCPPTNAADVMKRAMLEDSRPAVSRMRGRGMPTASTVSRSVLSIAFAATLFASSCWQSAVAEPPPVGAEVVDRGSLRDVLGRQRSLKEFDDRAALVLMFIGVECPLANRCLPEVLELEAEYRRHKVQFLAIYPHEHETIDLVAAHAMEHDIPFPAIKDINQVLADALAVERVPTFCVLDGDRILRYHGRLSDQFTVGRQRVKAQRQDLRMALDELIHRQAVTVPETPIDGCLLDRVSPPDRSVDLGYEDAIAPILVKRCQGCHQPDSGGPFSLATYEDAVRWSAMIREVVSQRRMPPWHADSRHGTFLNDRRMTPEEISQVVSWIDRDMPRGDTEKVAPAAVLPASRNFDVVLPASRSNAVPAKGVLDYIWGEISPSVTKRLFREDRWLLEAEVQPQDASVVHHVMVFSAPEGMTNPAENFDKLRVLTMWAPGQPSFAFPPDTAMRVPRNSRIVMQIHYTPNGKATVDRPRVKFRFATEAPKWEVGMRTCENLAFRIKPHDPHARGEFVFPIEKEEHTRLVGLYPHMHVRGKSFEFEAKYPDGHRTSLLSVPRYDFNWQTFYWFNAPVEIPVGGEIRAVAHWDNSSNNPDNPDPSVEVSYGWQTDQEMMIAGLMFIYKPTK
jgi:hypothetical protein